MKKIAIALLFIFSIFSISCEIGLGAAVDTDPPSLEIATPPVDAVIRDKFALAGDWTDDGTIASVTVKLERTDGNGEAINLNASFKEVKVGKGTWELVVDPDDEDHPIIDGAYQATVTIADSTNRKTIRTRTFTVDNTPPVIVLQRPGTKITETPDAYGQTFSLNGMGGDDNSIDHIDVNIYSDKECTNLIKTISKNNVAPTIELNVAVFEENVENDYATIYGSKTKNGTQVRYCTITAYDNAKRYPVEGERTAADDNGNGTSSYYLYDDIYTGVLDTHTITQIYKMLSGIYLLEDQSRSADTVSDVKTLLEQHKMTESNFSLNPENNPRFIVNGKDVLTGSGTDFAGDDYNISSGSTIVIEVSTGLDGISLNTASLRPYLLPCNAYGVATVENIPDNRIYLADAGTGAKSGTSYKFTVDLDSTKTYPGAKKLTIDGTYIFGVEGTDQKGNSVIPKGGVFGFRLSSNGAAPGLTVTNPDKTISYVKKDGKITFAGVVTCQEGLPTISIKNGTTTVWTKTFTAAEGTNVNGTLNFNFTHDIDYDGVTENSQIQYSVEASRGGLKTTVFKTVIYDKDAPTVTVGSLLPIAKKYFSLNGDEIVEDEDNPLQDDGDYLNGTVELKLTVNDDYDAIDTETNKAYLEILDADNSDAVIPVKMISGSNVEEETTVTEKHYITKLINGVLKIDTKEIQTGKVDKSIKFRVHAWDRAGNELVYVYPEPTTANPNPVIKVNQQTDYPVILPGNSDLSLKYDTKSGRDQATVRRSQIPSGGQLLLTLIDDDGIDLYKIVTTGKSDESSASAVDTTLSTLLNNATAEEGSGSTQLTVSKTVPGVSGYYWYKIWVKDKTGIESEKGPFIIKVTTAAPRLLDVTAVEEDDSDEAVAKYVGGTSSSKKKWKNKIEIDSSETPFYVFRKESTFVEADKIFIEAHSTDISSANLASRGITPVSSGNNTEQYDLIENPDSNKTYFYIVYDANWNASNEKPIWRYVDKIAPSTLTIKKPAASSESKAVSISGTSDTFTGTVNDADAGENQTKSKVANIQFAITNTSDSPAGTDWHSRDASDGTWNLNIDQLKENSGTNVINDDTITLYEGHYYLHMKAEDNAGNISGSISREFYVDQSVPTLNDPSVETYYKKDETASVTYTATDTNGLEAINFTVKKDGTELESSSLTTTYGISLSDDVPAANPKSFTRTITLPTDGNHDGIYEVTVTAVDVAGRKSTNKTFTTTIDCEKPEYKENTLKVGASSEKWSATSFYKDTTLKITGTYTEAGSGMDTIYFYVRPSGSTTLVPSDLTIKDTDDNPVATGSANFKSGSKDFSFTVENFKDNTYTNGTSTPNTLYIQTVDKAGNKSIVKDFAINVDTTAPELEIYKYKIGDNGTLKTVSGTVFINDTAKLIVYGNYTDGQSGVTPLTFTGTNGGQPTVKYSTDVASDSNNSYTIASITADNRATIKSWKAEFANNILGTDTLKVSGSNSAGLSANKNLFTISKDTTPPTFDKLNFTTDSDHFSVYAKKNANGSVVEKYYINNTQGKFIISGIADDIRPENADDTEGQASGVEKVKLEITGITDPYESTTAYFANIDLSGLTTTSTTATITVYDLAGNSTEYTLPEIIFDNDRPTGVHEIDATGKDLVFRISDRSNDDISSSNASQYGLTWNECSVTDINDSDLSTKIQGLLLLEENKNILKKTDDAAGGKYAGGSFGNSYTQKVRGSFSDGTGSGIKQIYYKIYNRSQSLIFDPTANNGEGAEWYYTEDDIADPDSTTYANVESIKQQLVEDVVNANQYLAPLSTPEYKRVFYNVEYGEADPFNGHKLYKNSEEVIERKKKNADGSWVTVKEGSPDYATATQFYKYWKIEETTYSFTIPQLSEGCNYLVIVAEDNVGNYYIDCSDPIEFGDEERIYSNYSMNVDTTVPTIALKDPATTETAYKKDNFIVKLTVTDPEVDNTPNSSSGIKSVVLNNKVSCSRSTVTGEENVWWANVDEGESSLLIENKSVTISATATDVAGNTSTQIVANIFKDTYAPTVTIDKPANADKLATSNADIKVNGTISLSGTAQDVSGGSGLNEKTKLKLYYTTNTTLGQKTASTITASDIKSSEDPDTVTEADKFIFLKETDNESPWTFTEIDTTTLSGTVYFMVSTQDKALGIGYSTPQKVIVDQDTDRPIIKMNQVTKANAATDYLLSKTVFGSIIDDDGDVQKLWVWSKKLNSNAEPSNPPTYNSGNNTWNLGATDTSKGWIEFGSANSKSTIENNNWQIDADDPDGDNIWFWAVQDAKGSIFWTKGDASPYILYKDTTTKEASPTTGIPFKYDTESPDITSVELIRLPTDTYKTGTTYYTAAEIQEQYMDVQTKPLSWSSHDNIVFGTDLALMYLKVTLTEKTGMSSTPLVIKQSQTNTEYLSVTNKINSSNNGNVYTYIVGPFNLSSKTTEEVTLKITATDLAGKTGSKEKTIIVDNDADITISKVSPKANAEQSGEFTFQGSVTDGHSSISEIKYYIPPYDTYNSWNTADDDTVKENVLKSIPDPETNSAWITISDPGLSFRIDFGGTNNFSDIIGYKTNGGASAFVNSAFANYDTGLLAGETDETGIYSVPIWFRVKDEVGNVKYIATATDTDSSNNVSTSDIKVKYNPNTDRPIVVITDPDITTDGIEKGGTFKISGTASDDEGIAEVWLQFDLGSGNFDNGSLTGVGNIPNTATETTPAYQGIKANGTKNWSYSLNASSLQSYTTTNKLVRVRAIAIDSDTQEPRVSAWSEILKIKINNDIPYIENLYVKQRADGSPEGNVKITRDYTSEMYISDTTGTRWFLEGVAYTSSSDKLTAFEAGNYKWTGNGTTLTPDSGNPTSPAAYAKYTTGNAKQIEFRIPITGDTKWTVSPKVTDNNTPAKENSSVTYTVNVDNTPPSFPDIENDEIKLYRDSYGISSNLLSESNFLQNSNGSSFTLAGKIIEQGSGFEKVVFYFMRDGSDGKKRVYNPMEEHGSDNKNNRTDIADSTVTTTEPIYINADNLPVLSLTVTNNATDGTLTADEIETNDNIRVGGLVYIGGLYRTITAKTGDTVTINPAYDGSETTALFVYGLVVDHTGEGENSDGSIRGDDGDGLLESFSGSQTKNFSWEATFNSANIPDGPIEIHVVAFDQAGNIGHGYTTTRASNNAPRITKVMLGTDLNGNNKYDYGSGEFSTFYAQRDDNQNPITKTGLKAWTLETKKQTSNSKSWKVKKGLAVIPEFVGGSGNFYYKFSKGTTVINDPEKISDTTNTLTETYLASYKLKDAGEEDLIKITGTNTNATWAYSTNKVNEVNVTNSGGSLTLDNLTIGSSNEDTDVYFRFTFWDSTEDSTPGFDTGSTILNLQVEQDITDNKEPKSVIKPFDWKGTGYKRTIYKSENFGSDVLDTADSIDELGAYSLGTTVETNVADNGTVTITKTTITPNNNLYGASKDNGHIELENDLSANVKTLFGDTDSAKDPKVSGKITFSGTAYDDTRLSSIWFKFDGFTPGTGLTRPDGTETYDVAPSGVTGYTQAAWYDSAATEWKVATPSANWEISVSDEYFDQKGHKAIWYLTIDTAQITNTAGKDKTLSIMTIDKQGQVSETTANTTSNDDDAYNKPEYKVDVVPYISGISTTNRTKGGLKDNNIRSASGKYSIIYAKDTSAVTYDADFITVNGFNLNPAAVRVVNSTSGKGTNVNKDSGVGVTVNTIGTDYKSFTASNVISNSGYLEVFVKNGTDYIRSLNNINNDDAYGSYTLTGTKVNGVATASVSDRKYAYNREANYDVTKNIQLTDDRYLKIWDMKDTGKKNGYYPNMIMDGDDPVFGFVDLNGTKDSSYGDLTDMSNILNGYQPQRAKFNGDTGTQSSIEYLIGGLSWDQMAMVKDSAGKYIHTSVYNYSGATMAVVYNQYASKHTWKEKGVGTEYIGAWGYGTAYSAMINEAGTAYVIERANGGGNNAIALESVDYGEGTLIGRYQNIKMVVNGNSTNTTGASVYMAYFDDNTTTKDVIFRTFQIKQANTQGWNRLGETGIRTNLTENNITGRIVARPSGKNYKGSKYLDIGVTSNNNVVIVYYDMEAGTLRMMYSGNTINGSSITPNPNWTEANVTFPSYVGTDVSMIIDGSNGIHITASDSSDSDLVYMYMPSCDSSVLKTVRVDQAFSVGTWTSIKVKGNTTDGYVPYIAYYNATETGSRDSIKLAYFADTTTKISAADQKDIQGVDANGYTTGKWEYMTVPAITPPQGGDSKFRAVCLDFDSATSGQNPVVGYLGTNLEFGKALDE